MPREISNHELIIKAFQDVDIVSELVERLPNGEFRNELEMDIILFGRSYGAKKLGPYARLLEYQPGETIVTENSWESSIFYVLVKGELDAAVTEQGALCKVGEVRPGSSFGEMALLSGTPRRASVLVSGKQTAHVLELMRPAIRLLRKLPKFGKALDRNYRSYGLSLTLGELTEAAGTQLAGDVRKHLADAARFVVYEKDHILFREGDPINRVLYIRDGWVQRVSGASFNPLAADILLESSVGTDFLGTGTCLGLEAIESNSDWKFTATARGRTEVLEIAVSRLREEPMLNDVVVPVLKSMASARTVAPPEPPKDKRVLTATSKEIETGIVDGMNVLVMDMAKCIRCGNCSLACHKMHGNSRLIRRGIHIERPIKPSKPATQSVLVPTVCMHCQDPECLTGCPTGAIARFPDGEIDINPTTCIGCGDCATQCPYNAISMVPMHADVEPPKHIVSAIASSFSLGQTELPPPVTATDDLLAVKCNLCKDTPMNPSGAKRSAYSCEENCPTGALVRVNPHEYFDEIAGTIGIFEQSKTHAIGVNIHKFDLRAMLWHLFGWLTVIVGGAAALFATYRFSQDVPLTDEWPLTMRWITGWVGLAGIIWVMVYPVRKQIYRRRAGALRYWMLSHIYIGVLAAGIILVHGGTSSGGLLTTALMITFDLTIATGIFGALLYVLVPRFMTRIEREPLLMEDLEARREELRNSLVRSAQRASQTEQGRAVTDRMRKKFLGLGYLFRQYLKREDLNAMLADARQEFRKTAETMSRTEEAKLMEAVENAATLRRIDALIYLHQLLKVWLPPHVLFTSLMLVLLVLHIVQVLYFGSR